MISVDMEIRNCNACGKTFKVSTKSKQEYCNKFCETSGEVWAGQKKVLKSVVKETGSVSVDVGKLTQSFEKKKSQDSALYARRTRNGTNSGTASVTAKTEKNTLNDESNGPKIIESDNDKNKESVMREIVSITSNVVEKENRSSTLPSVYSPQSSSLKEEISSSMSLLKSTGEHLHGVMKATTNPNTDPTIRLHEVDRVLAAAAVGKQIIDLIKVQHDLLKLAKEVHEES